MRRRLVVGSTVLALVAVGCDTQETKQRLLDARQELQQVKQRLAESEEAKMVEMKAREVAEQAQEEAAGLQTAAEEALANAKAEAEKVAADAKAQIANAQTEAKQLVADAQAKLAGVTQELEAARGRIAELEANAKQPAEEQVAEAE